MESLNVLLKAISTSESSRLTRFTDILEILVRDWIVLGRS